MCYRYRYCIYKRRQVYILHPVAAVIMLYCAASALLKLPICNRFTPRRCCVCVYLPTITRYTIPRTTAMCACVVPIIVLFCRNLSRPLSSSSYNSFVLHRTHYIFMSVVVACGYIGTSSTGSRAFTHDIQYYCYNVLKYHIMCNLYT